jgi:beta-glucuronidase
MPFRLLIPLLLLACLALPGTAVAQMPQPQALTAGWEFRQDPSDQGLRAGWANGDRAEDWDDVEVPHVFNPDPVDADFLGTIGWYRLRLTTPATPDGFAWALRFEGARRIARVWLNGHEIGHNSNAYQPFTLPADGMRPVGETNELVVRVHNHRTPDLREGWWNWGGLVRPVTLVPRGRVEWQDLGFLSDVDCTARGRGCGAVVRTDGWLHNRSRDTVKPLLVVRLTAPDGSVISKTVTARALQPGETRRVGFPVRVRSPKLWSPTQPNLYSAFAEVRLGAEVQQAGTRRVGLRYVRVVDGRLELNGRRLNLRGASIQEDVPGRGPALRESDVEQIVGDLQMLGANITRAQYPLNERLLERLDEVGILVWSQSPVYHEDWALRTPMGRLRAYRKVRGTVLYARNHPSVLTHSVANELTVRPDRTPGTRAFLERAVRIARDLDPTVPASVDLLTYPRIPRQRAYARFGLIGLNSYYGWYRGQAREERSTARLADLWPFLRDMHRKYPGQAMMVTEFGAEATFDGPAHVKETFAFQSRYVDRTLDIVDRANWLSGAIYWTAREFYVKPNWDGGAGRPVPRDALHNKGLITYEGQPKPAFYEAQRRFAHTPIYDG